MFIKNGFAILFVYMRVIQECKRHIGKFIVLITICSELAKDTLVKNTLVCDVLICKQTYRRVHATLEIWLERLSE